MPSEESYINERLDHLGIVAGVCQGIGLASWLDAQDSTHRQQVSVGTATVAMILNGLGFSNRQLYLVPQYFANKPVEHLLGAGIKAEMLNDDCLGRTLDWLYAHDPTKLFAGIARQARQNFGVKVQQIHVDTTSFSVSGEYAQANAREDEAEATIIAITLRFGLEFEGRLKPINDQAQHPVHLAKVLVCQHSLQPHTAHCLADHPSRIACTACETMVSYRCYLLYPNDYLHDFSMEFAN